MDEIYSMRREKSLEKLSQATKYLTAHSKSMVPQLDYAANNYNLFLSTMKANEEDKLQRERRREQARVVVKPVDFSKHYLSFATFRLHRPLCAQHDGEDRTERTCHRQRHQA